MARSGTCKRPSAAAGRAAPPCRPPHPRSADGARGAANQRPAARRYLHAEPLLAVRRGGGNAERGPARECAGTAPRGARREGRRLSASDRRETGRTCERIAGVRGEATRPHVYASLEKTTPCSVLPRKARRPPLEPLLVPGLRPVSPPGLPPPPLQRHAGSASLPSLGSVALRPVFPSCSCSCRLLEARPTVTGEKRQHVAV